MTFQILKSQIQIEIDKNDFVKAHDLAEQMLVLENLKANQLKFAYRKLCVISNKMSDYQRIEKWASKAIIFDPNNLAFNMHLLRSKVKLQKWEEAFDLSDKVLAIDANNTKANLIKGEILLGLNKPQAARNHYQDIKLTEDDLLHIDHSLAKVPLHENNWEKALELHKNLLVKYPNTVESYMLLASFYMDYSYNSEAKEILLVALKKFGHSNNLDLLIGESLLAEQDYLNGISMFKKVNNLETKPNLIYKIALQLIKSKRPEATFYIDQITNPVKKALAQAQYAALSGNPNEELAILEKLAKDHDNQFDVVVAYLDAMFNSFQMNKFWQVYESSKRNFLGNLKIESITLKAMQAEGRYEESIEMLKKLTLENPANSFYNFSLAHNLIQLGRNVESKKQLLILAKEPYAFKRETYNEMCLKAFTSTNEKEWDELFDIMCTHPLTKDDIKNYCSFLETNNAENIAELFLNKYLHLEKNNHAELTHQLKSRISIKKIIKKHEKEIAQTKIHSFLKEENINATHSKVIDTRLDPFYLISLADKIKKSIVENRGYCLYSPQNLIDNKDSSEIKNVDCLGISDISMINNFEESQNIVSAQVSQDLDYWGLFDYIISEVESCSVISSNSLMIQYIEEQFLIRVDNFQLNRRRNKFNLKFEEHKQNHISFIERIGAGDLVFVDAPEDSLSLCLKIKEKRAVAIDIGLLSKNWIAKNKKKYSYFNPRFLASKNELSV